MRQGDYFFLVVISAFWRTPQSQWSNLLHHRIHPSLAFISAVMPLEHCCFGSGAAGKVSTALFFFFFLFIYSFPAHFDSLVHAVQTGLISGQKDPLFYMSIEHFSIVELILC